jgi:hypothetical protein
MAAAQSTLLVSWSILFCLLLHAQALRAQVFTVTTEQVEGRFLRFEPTHVDLPKMHAGPFTVEALERSLEAEHGYAMRPLPLASKGLNLVANGPLTPSGSDYVVELNSKGISSRPGDKVVVTKIQVKKDRLVLEFNNGPDLPHRFLRHVEVGGGGATMPLARDTGEQAGGSRLTILFPGGVPNVTGDEVKALIAPIVGFGEKSPAESYADTLTPLLRQAILDHRVLVGMDGEMVLHALGTPAQRVRERDEGRPFTEWIYGEPPEKTQFVRFQHDRVTQVEVAEVGRTPMVRTANEVGDYWQTSSGLAANEREIKLGDRTAQDRAEENAPAAPPSLRKPGEALPQDKNSNQPSMQPVQFPAGKGTGTSTTANPN